MAVCPSCQQTLPDWAQQCQFCGAKLVISSTSATKNPYARGRLEVPRKVVLLYTLCAVFWVLDGIRYILSATGFPNFGSTRIGPGMILFILLAAATMIAGLLLIAKVPIVQRAVRTIAWINIILGAINLLSPLFAAWTWWIILNVAFSAIQVAAGIYMIYAQGVIDLYAD